MTLILGAAALCAFAGSAVLLGLGVPSLTIRYPLAALFGYLGFVGGVRVWLWYVASAFALEPPASHDGSGELGDALEVAVAIAGDGGGAPTSGGSVTRSGGSSGGNVGDAGDDGGGVAVVAILAVLALAIAIVTGAVVWVLVQAPVILGEAALPLLAAGMFRRKSEHLDRQGWAGGVLRTTIVPFLLVLFVALGLGASLHALCPGAVTLGEVLHTCALPGL